MGFVNRAIKSPQTLTLQMCSINWREESKRKAKGSGGYKKCRAQGKVGHEALRQHKTTDKNTDTDI